MANIDKLKIYNSLTREKEIFEPIIKNKVGMYVCGPTVYSDVHLGNCRTFISFDMMFRYLQHLGYKVRYVRNITDAGHLENDADHGEDKISKKARLEELEPMEVVQKYTLGFHDILNKFNNLPPSIEPTATGHIIEQITMIKSLLNKKLAYLVNGSVYFDVLKYNESNNYGELSGRKIEDLISNTRQLDGQSEKKNPQDFALWKKASDSHIMRWQSPWSEGFPGWHLECSAMSGKYLGKQFDIHGGGMDLKFPHHECEIAQSKAFNGVSPVKYWLHANMLTLNGQKMSKSTGNTLLPNELFYGGNDILSKEFSPEVVRFFIMQSHYRSIMDFSNDALLASEKGFIKLLKSIDSLKEIKTYKTSTVNIKSWLQECYNAMNDDFNTPVLISNLFEASKIISKLITQKETISKEDLELFKNSIDIFLFDILGIKKVEKENSNSDKFDSIMNILIEIRNDARDNKNWELSDQIREKLSKENICIMDCEGDTKYSIK